MTGVQVNGPSGGEDRLTENVTLNFREMKAEYIPQLPDGSQGEPVSMKWDNSRGGKE